jgi:hypothetical protein
MKKLKTVFQFRIKIGLFLLVLCGWFFMPAILKGHYNMTMIINPFLMKATLFSDDAGSAKNIKYNQIGLLKQDEVDPTFLATLLDDIKAKVSANDTTAGFLNGKLVQGDHITLTEQNDGGDETLKISVDMSTLNDEKVKASATDTTTNYLWDKLAAGSDIFLHTNNPAGNEKVEINSFGMQRISSDDTDYGYTDNKLNTDYTLKKTLNNPSGNENIELGMCDFAGLTALDLQCLDCGIVQDLDGYKRKFTQSMLQALSSRAWIRTGISNSQYTPVTDTTDTAIDLDELDPTNANFLKNIILTWAYGDNKARCLGRVSTVGSVGASYTEADLVALHGSILEIAAQDYSNTVNEQCWFSLLLDAINGGDSFGIKYLITPTNTSIDFVINAVFMFNYPPGTNDASLAKWVLVSYETLKPWFQKLTYTENGGANYAYSIDLPSDGTTLKPLPHDGYYNIELTFDILARWRTLTPAPMVKWGNIIVDITDADGTIKPIMTDFSIISIAEAPIQCPGGSCCCLLENDYYIYRLSYAGIVHVLGANCAGRKITVGILFDISADATPALNLIYTNWKYMGKKLGHWCNEFETLV